MPSPPGQGKPLLFYAAVLLVTGSSVVFGLNWTAAPLPPMPETAASVQAAKLAARFPPPPAPPAVKTVQQASPAPPPTPAPAVAAVAPSTPMGNGTPSIMAPEPTATRVTSQATCDIAACSAAYHSFRASDCTWQPYEGPRRLCDKGQATQAASAAVPAATATPAQGSIAAAEIAAANAANAAAKNGHIISTAPAGQAALKCDVEACKKAYFTFNPLDCTYQPSEGPRKFCDKGLPPQAATPPPAPATAAAATLPPATTTPPPKCNVEACKQAYFTFNPADCTYQPTDGPRTLCEK